MFVKVIDHVASEHSGAYCGKAQYTRGPDKVSIDGQYDGDDHFDDYYGDHFQTVGTLTFFWRLPLACIIRVQDCVIVLAFVMVLARVSLTTSESNNS